MPDLVSPDAAATLTEGQRFDVARNVATREQWRYTYDRPTRRRPGPEAAQLPGTHVVIVETVTPIAPICADDLEVLCDVTETVPDPEPIVVEVTARARDLIVKARQEDS